MNQMAFTQTLSCRVFFLYITETTQMKIHSFKILLMVTLDQIVSYTV